MLERPILMVISMIDEMMTFLESDYEAKALTRQVTGHKDLLSSSELDESVTNAIENRQMQQAEFVTAVYHKCTRHQEVPPGEVGASRPCEAQCEQADDPGEVTFQFHSCMRGGVHCLRDANKNFGSSELQDIMTKYNEVNCVDENMVWNTDHIETVELVNLMGQTAQGLYSGEARHESPTAHDRELPGA